MNNIPFKKNENDIATNTLIEEKLRSYVAKRYPWLTFVESRVSYAVLRFEFVICEPDFASKKVVNELAEKLDIVLAAVNCNAFIYKDRVIINIPRENKDILYLGNGIEELLKKEKEHVQCYVGECDDGAPAIVDFVETPHLLIGGTTGSGKSVSLNNILLSLMYLYTPDEVTFYILDDKNELSFYKNEPHVIGSAFSRDGFDTVLSSIVKELKIRRAVIGNSGSVDIDEYNAKQQKKMPHTFVIFDEADTILRRDSQLAVSATARRVMEEICSEGRSLGVHVVIASQKPEKRNIDTTIKSNIPGRLALQVANAMDSRVILDEKGAEKLTGNGDAILKLNGTSKRIQCAYTTTIERKEAVERLVGGTK